MTNIHDVECLVRECTCMAGEEGGGGGDVMSSLFGVMTCPMFLLCFGLTRLYY